MSAPFPETTVKAGNLGGYTGRTGAANLQPAPVEPGSAPLPRPVGLTPVLGPPVPLFQHLGSPAPMSVAEFNTRLETVTQAHMQATGVKPNPTVALQTVLSPTPTDQLASLGQFVRAKVDPNATANAAALALHPAQSDEQFLAQLKQITTTANATQNPDVYNQFVKDNQSRIQELQKGRLASQTNAAIRAAAVIPQFEDPASTLGIFGTAASQIVGSLLHAPGGIYTMLNTEYNADRWAIEHHTIGPNPYIAKERTMVKGMAHNTAQDFEHPTERPGYLFLDLLGGLSAAGGTAARAGEASRALTAGEGVGGAVKAFTREPPLQRITLSYGGYSEEMPLSSNPFVAAIQKRILTSRQDRANAALDSNLPAPARSVLLPQAAQDFLDEHLSFARKIGREAEARLRVEHVASMALRNELDAAAGAASTTSRVLGRIRVTEKSGLTRGEQKAIQALSWDDPNPLAAEERFHQSMIEQGIGDRAAHLRQIADLALARKALESPRPRFQRALDLTAQVIAEQQRLKIEELGLAPETAEGRVAKAGQALREEPITGGTPVTETSQYAPTQPRGKTKRQPSQARGRFAVSSGPFGIPLGREMPELTHDFNGDALRAGDTRIDATNLAGESYARTVRAVTVKNQWNKLWGAASPTKRTEWDIPIRDANTIPDALRTVVAKLDEGVFTEEDAGILPADMADLIRALYPHERDITPDQIEHVKWIDSRLLGDVEGAPSRSAKTTAAFFQTVNSPVRFATLYLRPAYALNLLGNVAMLTLDQGFLTSLQNIARAMSLDKTDSAANAATIRELVGAGKAQSYVTGASGRVSQAVAHFWNRFADRDERVAAFLYYADRLGYKTAADRDRLLNGGKEVEGESPEGGRMVTRDLPVDFLMRLVSQHIIQPDRVARIAKSIKESGYERDSVIDLYVGNNGKAVIEGNHRPLAAHAAGVSHIPVNIHYLDSPVVESSAKTLTAAGIPKDTTAADLVEATRRAKKSLVEFDNMTPFEKNMLRHVIFVYPWVRGSAVWSIRAILEHPAKADLLAHLGEEEMQNDPILQNAPSWFKRIGYFPVGWTHDGQPKVVNPTSINTFSTFGDLLNVVTAATAGDQFSSLSDLFGPAATFLTHAATGRDEYGNRYPDGQWFGAAKDMLAGLPQAGALGLKPSKKPHAVTPVDIRNRGSLESHLNSLAHQTVFGPGWLDGYGSLIAGGFSPKPANEGALAAKGDAEMPAPQRIAHELKLINFMLTKQGEFLDRPVPTPVRQSVRDMANLTNAYAAFHKANGRTPTAKEKVGLALAYLTSKGRIPAAEAETLTKQLKPLQDDQISAFKTALFDKYAAGKQSRQWDSDVRALYSFKQSTFNEKAAALHAQGLSPQAKYQRPQSDLDEYGRGFLLYQKTLREAHARKAPASELRLIVDEHSKPVNGLPSYAAIAWANQTPAEQQHAVIRDSYAGWGTLTSVEKTLVGRQVNPAVSEGWHAYATLTTRDALAKKGYHGTLDKDQRLAIVKQIDRYYGLRGAFTKDFLFSKEPLYQRLGYLHMVKDSPDRGDWQQLFSQAKRLDDAVKAGQTTSSAATQAWDDYTEQIEAHYRTDDKRFFAELAPILKANPKFLKELIH